MSSSRPMGTLSFSSLIAKYSLMQSNVALKIQQLASMTCQASPGAFLMMQFQMAQVTQIGDSLSNLIGQVQSVIKNAIGNQRVQ